MSVRETDVFRWILPLSQSLPTGFSALSADVRGSLFMIVSMTSFAVNDTFVKIATGDISPSQVMLVRGVMATILLFGIAYWRGALAPSRLALHPLIVVRTLADVGATIAYITALANMPLANAAAIFQALPLIVTVGAALFLGESVGWRRWTAIGVGFVGVIIIVRPGTDGFTVFSVAVLVSVLFAAVRDLTTRRMPASMPTLFVSAITALGTSICGAALLPVSGGWVPLTGPTFLSLFGATFAIALGYVFIVKAMRSGDMGFVAPFRYSVLVVAFVLGTIIFQEPPGLYEIVGSVIVVGSGVYMIIRESQRGRVKLPKGEVH